MQEVLFALGQQLVGDFEVVVRDAVAKSVFDALFLVADLLKVFYVEPVRDLDVTFVALLEVNSKPEWH